MDTADIRSAETDLANLQFSSAQSSIFQDAFSRRSSSVGSLSRRAGSACQEIVCEQPKFGHIHQDPQVVRGVWELNDEVGIRRID